MKKKIMIYIAVAILALLIVMLLISLGIDKVEVVKIAKSDLNYSFTEDGVVTSKQKEYVYPKVSGTVSEINVKNNDYVEAGQKLFAMDVDTATDNKKVLNNKYSTLLNQANIQQSAIEKAQRQYDYSYDALNKGYALVDVGGISMQQIQDLEKAKNDAYDALEESRKTLNYYNSLARETKTQIDIANNDIAKYITKSTIAGTVAGNNLELGMLVNQYDKAMTIYDMNSKQIEVYVKTEHANLIEAGEDVKIKQKQVTGNKEFTGKIVEIGQTTEERTSSLGLKEYRIKVVIELNEENTTKLGMGYDVEVEFFMKTIKDTIAVSKTSIFSKDSKKYIWALEHGKLKKVEITEKTNTQNMVEVEGIEEGMLIVKDANNDKLVENNKYKADIIK